MIQFVNKLKHWIPVFVLIFAFLVSGVVLFAWEKLGRDWTHMDDPMGEDFVVCDNCGDCTGEYDAVQRAAETWNNGGALFRFTSGGRGTLRSAEITDGVNCIAWDTGGERGVLATTYTLYYEDTGEIIECDCIVNDDYTWSTSESTPGFRVDVESVILHELGHWVGLDHCDPPAVMQPDIGYGVERRALEFDDIYGIRDIYGRSFTHGCSTLGFSNKVISTGPRRMVINTFMLFPLIIGLIILRILRRKR